MATQNQISLTRGQKTLFYGGVTIIGLALAAPILTFAAAGAFSLIKVGGCVVALYAVWTALPWISLKWKNVVLRLIKSEARANPIETLQNEYLARSKKLEIAIEYRVQITGMRDSLAERLQAFKKRHGATDESMEKMLSSSTALVDRMIVKESEVKNTLAEFKKKLAMEEDRYKMALAAGGLSKAVKGAVGENDPLQEFVSNEALDSIRDQFNQSMAEINSLLEGDEVVKQLSHDKSVEGELSFLKIETGDLAPVKA